MKNIFQRLHSKLQSASPSRRFAVALLPTAVVLFGIPLFPEFINITPAILFYPVFFWALWIGGSRCGLVSCLSNLTLAVIYIRPKLMTAPLDDLPYFIRANIFLFTCLVAMWLVGALQKALKKSHEAVSLRDDFINIVSHELKTPLTALKLNLDIVKRIQTAEHPDSSSMNQLNASIRQVHRLERLITSMMDLTHFDSGQLKLIKRRCDLKKIIQDVATTFQNETLTITPTSESFEGNWDQVRIEQIVSNIIHNAIKYGRGKPIQVFLGSDNKKVWFAVKDQGPGIDPKDQQRIFGRFQRVNSSTDVQGLGLGLYLTKKLVEVHEGEICVESTPGEGALFKVLLPA